MGTTDIIHLYKQGERKFFELDLRYENLDSVNLSGGNLYKADLSRSVFNGCNLSRVDARHVKMWRTQVINSNLSNANLYRGNLIKVSFTDSNLDSVDLSYSYLLNGYFNNVNLRGVNFHGTDLTGCEFVNCNLPQEWFNTHEGEIKLAEKVVNHLSCEVDLDAAGVGQSDITLDFICTAICPHAVYPVKMTSFKMPSLVKYLSPKHQIDEVIEALIRITVGEESVFVK